MTKEELVKQASEEGIKLDENVADKIIKDSNLENVAGGYPGHDKYSSSEYSKAGVSWVHHVFKKDEYYFNGHKISQDVAEEIADYYYDYNCIMDMETFNRRFGN